MIVAGLIARGFSFYSTRSNRITLLMVPQIGTSSLSVTIDYPVTDVFMRFLKRTEFCKGLRLCSFDHRVVDSESSLYQMMDGLRRPCNSGIQSDGRIEVNPLL
jgi:hypothetical protein